MALCARGRFLARAGLAAGTFAALMAVAGEAWGQPGRTPPQRDDSPDPRISTESGRLKAVWPKPPQFDHLHMKLDLTFADLMSCAMSGVEELTVTPRGSARDTLVLDCGKQITVQKVEVNGRVLKHTHADAKLTIDLGRSYSPGEKLTVVTTYTCDFTKERGEGLTLVKPRENAESDTDKSPCIYSQGEAESNSHWFPCHDFPNERLTTEITAHVPEGYVVSSNGYLVETKPDAKGGLVAWHWLQDKPHVNYLVTIVIAKYSIVSLDKPGSKVDLGHRWKAGEEAPVIAFVPVGKEKQAEESLGNTPDMIRLFEKLFDQQYPWDKYAQVLVRGFNGGMENTSATTEYAAVLRGERGDQDDLVSHELAHQWFGDLMTCRTWEHIWLNEGWASYCEALWNEEKGRKAGGDKKADDAYMKTVSGFYRQQRSNHASNPRTPAMVSNRYTRADEVFQKPDNPYPKGGMILHMLRERLGDETFFRGVRLYIARNKFGLVETDMFRRALEEASGQSLERFFDQWCMRPGVPKLEVELEWNDGSLTVKAAQTQTVDEENPAYAFSLPLYVKLEDGTRETIDLDMDSREVTKTIKLKSKPKDVTVDPRNTVLASHEIKKPLAMWIEQMESAPTVTARMEAADHLAHRNDPEAAAALTRLSQRGDEDKDLVAMAKRAVSFLAANP